jgi:hypothetical protein
MRNLKMERLEVLLLNGGSDDPFVVEAPLGSTDAELAPLIAAELGLAPSAKLCLPSPRPSSGPWHVSQGAHCAPAGAACSGSAESAEMVALRRRIASLLAENEALKQQQQQQQQRSASPPAMAMQSPDKAAGPTPSASRANAASPSAAAPSEAMSPSSSSSSSHSPLDVDVRPLVLGAVGAARSLASLVAGRFAVLDFWTTK